MPLCGKWDGWPPLSTALRADNGWPHAVCTGVNTGLAREVRLVPSLSTPTIVVLHHRNPSHPCRSLIEAYSSPLDDYRNLCASHFRVRVALSLPVVKGALPQLKSVNIKSKAHIHKDITTIRIFTTKASCKLVSFLSISLLALGQKER